MTSVANPRRPRGAWRGRLGLALVAGTLHALAFPGVIDGDHLWWLVVVAPAGLILALEGASTWREAWAVAALWSTAFFGIGLHWFNEVHPGAFAAGFGYMLVISLVGLPIASRVLAAWPRAPRTVLAPILLGAVETLRGAGNLGFPWFDASLAVPIELPIVQAADLVGAWGIALAVTMIPGLIVDLWHLRAGREDRAGRRRVLGAAAGAIAVLAGLWLYGAHRVQSLVSEPGPRVLVVQSNVAQKLKQAVIRATATKETLLEHLTQILDDHVSLTLSGQSHAPDLVAWGETMYPQDLSSRRNATHVARIADLVERLDTSMVIGGFRIDGSRPQEPPRIYNAAFFFTPEAPSTVFHLADAGFKRRLVPGGEFTPFRQVPGVEASIRAVAGIVLDDLHPGDEPVRFVLPRRDAAAVPFGVFICFESFYPRLLADLVLPDPGAGWGGAGFLLTLSNEGWFGASAELDQHLHAVRLRAIEMRRDIVRATNTGITAHVAADGRIVARLTDAHGRDREISGILAVEPRLSHEITLAARTAGWGRWLALAAAGLLALRRRVHGQQDGDPGADSAVISFA